MSGISGWPLLKSRGKEDKDREVSRGPAMDTPSPGSRGRLATLLFVVSGAGGAIGMEWLETRDSAPRPSRPRTAPATHSSVIPDASGVDPFTVTALNTGRLAASPRHAWVPPGRSHQALWQVFAGTQRLGPEREQTVLSVTLCQVLRVT